MSFSIHYLTQLKENKSKVEVGTDNQVAESELTGMGRHRAKRQ